ncbi:DUF397 domain-containing protein [Streptomyces sp. NPDC007100]|uniref:DUF397 domain-containing protein n=1 Tax=Streptomyces sp. NPDC007100 TaxID=3155602 RepID=UPI0033D382DE
MSITNWQKSSYSGNASNCVELAVPPGEAVLMRESDQPSVQVVTTRAALLRFLRFMQVGATGE